MTQGGQDPFSRLLYPMLSDQPPAGRPLLDGLAGGPLEKALEGSRLRVEVLGEYGSLIAECARAMAGRFMEGGRLLVFGNGGSATAAADMAGEFLSPLPPARPLPALSLAADIGTLTAVANDVRFEDVFARQILALGRPGDTAVALSTSGNSENLLRAMEVARKGGLLTVSLAGYDGGRLAAGGAVDYCFVVRSSSVHRIQEVQATVYHTLWYLVQRLVGEGQCV